MWMGMGLGEGGGSGWRGGAETEGEGERVWRCCGFEVGIGGLDGGRGRSHVYMSVSLLSIPYPFEGELNEERRNDRLEKSTGLKFLLFSTPYADSGA